MTRSNRRVGVASCGARRETADNATCSTCAKPSLMFVGKLDAWEQPNSAVPADLSCLALPLVRLTGFATWNAIVERTAPLSVRPARHADDLAMLRYRA